VGLEGARVGLRVCGRRKAGNSGLAIAVSWKQAFTSQQRAARVRSKTLRRTCAKQTLECKAASRVRERWHGAGVVLQCLLAGSYRAAAITVPRDLVSERDAHKVVAFDARQWTRVDSRLATGHSLPLQARRSPYPLPPTQHLTHSGMRDAGQQESAVLQPIDS
jgi:hypothetical protein